MGFDLGAELAAVRGQGYDLHTKYLNPQLPRTLHTIGFAIPAVYLAGVTAVAARFAADQPAGVRARVPLVLAAMHSSWGAGFLTSPRRLARRH